MIQEVRVGVQRLSRFEGVIPRGRLRKALRVAGEMQQRFARRVVWNAGSTVVGGGVAEMLQSLLCYTRWVVISGTPGFYRITKRIHHALHGATGDGSALDDAARTTYEQVLRANADELVSLVCPGDIVILHDPQTAGLAPLLLDAGVRMIWRCQIGSEEPNSETVSGWEFLRPYLEPISTACSRARATSR